MTTERSSERQRLDLDLDSLFPGEEYTIGKNKIKIRPFGADQLSDILKKLEELGGIITSAGITWDNLQSPDKFLKLTIIIFDHFPELIEEATNVHVDDIKKLPLEIIMELLDRIFAVNLASKDNFAKNWQSLTKSFTEIFPNLTEQPEMNLLQNKKKHR